MVIHPLSTRLIKPNTSKATIECVIVVRLARRNGYREFKKLRRQLQGKRHIEIELCVKLGLLQLLHVDHVVQNRRTVLSIYCRELALSSEPQI